MNSFGLALIGANAAVAAGGGGGASVPWTADGLGGTVSNLGGGTYEIDTATAFQGAVCGPLTGDFTCTIDPTFGATYAAEVGVAVGAIADPANDIYDGRECEGINWSNGGSAEAVYNNKTGGTDYSGTEAAPNGHTYEIARSGTTLTFKKDGATLFSRSMAGTLYLYASVSNLSGKDSTVEVRTVA